MAGEFDLEQHLGAVSRSVSAFEREGKPARAVTLSRQYRTDIADLWQALTQPERLARWFLPVSGELRLGGRYQLQGNASGTITGCQPPRRLDLTWEFGDNVSWVEVRLQAETAGRSRLSICHIAIEDEHWQRFGPGAAGVGWELGLIGLDVHLTDPASRFDEAAFSASPDYSALLQGSTRAWAVADIAAGADAGIARAAAARTEAFYSGTEPH